MDWLAGIFELLGLYIIGCRSKSGFLFNITGNLLWILYVFISNSTFGLLLVVIPALLINIINYGKWNN